MSEYSWPIFPYTGTANFELIARGALEEWRTNSVAIEARLNNIEDGTFWATSGQVIDGSAIIDGTLAYSSLDGLMPYGQLEAVGTPLEGYAAVYRSAGDSLVWESIAGVVGQDSYTVKWNSVGAPYFLESHIASQSEAEEGVATDKLMTPERTNQAIQTLGPAGMIAPFAMEAAPSGWASCDGSVEDPTDSDFINLFAAIGTTFGGDGITTFNLPDLRGEFIRGWDNARVSDPDAAERTAMHTGGATGDHVGSVQTDEIEAHVHQFHTESYAETLSGRPAGNRTSGGVWNYLDTTSAGDSTETRPRNVYMHYCIKL